MDIEAIYISCYRYDVQLTRACVASIRTWHPKIPIFLIKDLHYGDFNTRDIERHWRVQIYDSPTKSLGWGFGKVHIITQPRRERCLLLDSDTVLAGPVLDRLNALEADFVVDKEDFDDPGICEQFFDLGLMREFDTGFDFPCFGFNTGQVVATTGLLKEKDFAPYLNWETKQVKRPDLFKKGEQGLVNYVLLRKLQDRAITLWREPFMVWPGVEANVRHIRVENLVPKKGYPEVIHWAGLRWGKTLQEMPRADILLYFEDMYYDCVPNGRWLRQWRTLCSSAHQLALNLLRGRS